MRAIVQHRYGSADALRLEEVATPPTTDSGVLVRVRAAAVNARDWHLMRGDPYLSRLMTPAELRPSQSNARVRGTDFAGRVEAVGREVIRFQPGDDVFGESPGAFAEYISVHDELLEPKPANLTFEQAAAIPLAANTALMGLRDTAQVQPGQHVLINGASGGVGTFAVQIAKSLGAHVTGVCSARNVEMVRSLGADQVFDYARDDFTRTGHRYDVVLDLVGNRPLRDLRRALTPTGTLVLSGGGVSKGGSVIGPIGLIVRGELVSRFVRHRILTLTATPSMQNLATLRHLAESEEVTPVIDRTYPLHQVPDAIRYLETEHARAKVVITV